MRIAAEHGERLRDAVLYFLQAEIDADDAGRCDEHLLGTAPTWRATNSTVERATAMPASPVHALAHPLLQTIALARPPDISRFARETSTGAACVLFVVNTAAAETGLSAVITMTSSGQACVGGLMPAYTPAALKPAGAVMPPSIVWIREFPCERPR